MNKKPKMIHVAVVFAIIAGITVSMLSVFNQVSGININTGDKTSAIDVTLIEDRLQGIGRIDTAEYTFSTVAESEKEYKQFAGINIPFTSKQIRASYDGVVTAGFDLSDILIQFYGNKYIVTLHEPSISNTQFYNEEYTYESQNPFNQLSSEDYETLKSGVRLEMISSAIDQGIYEEAKITLEGYIEDFICNLVGENTVIEFQYE